MIEKHINELKLEQLVYQASNNELLNIDQTISSIGAGAPTSPNASANSMIQQLKNNQIDTSRRVSSNGGLNLSQKLVLLST